MTISESQVRKIQGEWADGIVAIGKAFTDGGDYKSLAEEFIKRLYGHEAGDILFKPTLASAVPFRHNFTDTLSYFVGGDIAEDGGFAIKPWQKVRFADDRKIFCDGDFALSMGHYFMTDLDGAEIKVEFSFAYFSSDGDLKIKLHHSSLPYQPA